MTFEEVMAKFERCYDINVEILRDDLPQIEFQRCKLRISEGIDHAPRGCCSTRPISGTNEILRPIRSISDNE